MLFLLRHRLRNSPFSSRSMRKISGTSPSLSHPHSGDVTSCEEDGNGHLPPLKTKDQPSAADSEVTVLENSIAKQLSISAETMEEEESENRKDEGKELTAEETIDAGPKFLRTRFMNPPVKRRPSLVQERLILDPEAYAADGHLRTMYSRPDFLKAYAEARKFRYIRHKNIPDWEKELSLQEIFGHNPRTEHSPQSQAVINPKH